MRFQMARWAVAVFGASAAVVFADGCSSSRAFTPHGGTGGMGLTSGAGGKSGNGPAPVAGATANGGKAGSDAGSGGNPAAGGGGAAGSSDGGEPAEGGAGASQTNGAGLGSTCSASSECESGHCADHVCCDSACSGQCEACNARGKCTAVTGKPVAPRKACAGSSSCEGTCDGTNVAACAFPDGGTLCAPAACSAGEFAAALFCDGAGSCMEDSVRSCPNGCATSGEPRCAEDCTPTSCATGSYCDDATGACKPTIASGESCSADAACASGSCIAGVCCQAATACGGGCTSWSFDAGTSEGWVADTDPGFPVNGGGATNGVTNITTSSTTFHDGTRALAVPANANGQIVSVTVPVCTRGNTLNLAGFTLSAWVRISGTPLGPYAFLFFDAWGASGSVDSPVLTGDNIVVLDTWYHLTTTFSSTVDADHVAIRLNPEMSWTGTLYIDSVTLTGP